MPSPVKTAKTDSYTHLRAVSNSMNECNDCAVVAVAMAAEVSYPTAHEALKQAGRKDGQGTYTLSIIHALKSFGLKLEDVSPRYFISRYPGNHSNLKSVTSHHPERFHNVWADGETYLMLVQGGHHILAIVDGVNHDWTKGTAKRAKTIYRVVKA